MSEREAVFVLRQNMEYRNNKVLIKKYMSLLVARKCNVKGPKMRVKKTEVRL